MAVNSVNTLQVSKEAYLYLQSKFKEERGGKPFTEKGIERLILNFERFQNKGFITLRDYSLGWNCEEMKRILDEKGFVYKDGESTSVISLG